MSAKIITARRAAFLKALEASGNITLAAERAKVSRRWAQTERKGDPAFDAACKAALEASFGKLRAKGANRPPSGWGFLDGAELVVRGTAGAGTRRVQIARARLRQISPRVEDRFLAALAATCNVKAACAEAGISKSAAYNHRNRWRTFGERWDEAVERGYTGIEFGLVDRACNLFSASELPEHGTEMPMSVDQAIHLLHMHKHAVHGTGRAPGKKWQPRRGIEYYRESILRKLDAIRRADELSETEKARNAKEWALRRRSG